MYLITQYIIRNMYHITQYTTWNVHLFANYYLYNCKHVFFLCQCNYYHVRAHSIRKSILLPFGGCYEDKPTFCPGLDGAGGGSRRVAGLGVVRKLQLQNPETLEEPCQPRGPLKKTTLQTLRY